MTDKDFKDAWASAIQDTRTIILFEDFDNIYHKRTPVNAKTKLNFDTILNTISGIQDMSGVILIITTNDITKIDEAIGVSTDDGISTRPGRIDSVIYLGKMEDKEKEKLICKILKDWPDLITIAMNSTTNYTAAQVQEHCIKIALEKLNENVTVIK
jgi:SpoVK/Ycf46/Vps4 family AAA+-type ATPase